MTWFRVGALGSIAALLASSACGEDAAPGSTTGANTTSGTGPTTFQTFSTTAPMVTSQTTDENTETTDDTSADSSSGTGSSSGTDTDSSSSGDGLCPQQTHACVLAPPEDWNGPIALHNAEINPLNPLDPKARAPEAPECGDAYPTLRVEGFSDIDAAPAACECECSDANAALCDNSTTLRFYGDDDSCEDNVPQAVTIFAGSCTTLPAEFEGSSFYTAQPVPSVGGACQPSSDFSVEPATFGTRVSVCGGAEVIEDAGCADERECAPLPDEDATACIWRDGEHACPDGFDQARMVFESIDDERGCESCSCGSPVGLCDSATVSLWNQGTCLVPAAGVVLGNGECDPSGTATSARAASLNVGEPTAFCAPSEPVPDGDAIGTEPTTVCCAR